MRIFLDNKGVSTLWSQFKAKLAVHANNSDIHVTAADKAAWDSKADLSDIINRNLLDNPNFLVNQRGQTDYTASGSAYAFTLDRWIISRAVVSVIDGGISAAWNGTDSTGGWIQQHIENAAAFAGMTITVSALVDGEVLSGTTTVPTTVNGSNSIATSNPSINFTVGHYSNNRLGVAIILLSDTPCTIGWVKAEIGTKATPFVPPSPAEELAKCQRYFNSLFVNGIPVQFIGGGIAVSDSMATILINLPTAMRLPAPEVSLTGTLYLVDGAHSGDNSIAVHSIAGSYMNRNVLQLNLSTPSGVTLDRAAAYLLSRRDADTALTVSAEL